MQRFSSVRDQVAGHLEGEIGRGRWLGVMPGRDVLARELGVNRKTVEAALELLEERGVLVGAGAGRRRRIAEGVRQEGRTGLRVGILLYEALDRSQPYLIDLLHRLEEAGHVAFFSRKTQLDLRRDVAKIADSIRQTEADAWVVLAGSRALLEWFVERGEPVYALFGRRRKLPIAGGGPDKMPAMLTVVRRLMGLGHRRIVMLLREEHRLPKPGLMAQTFLSELAAGGVTPGAFHLPDWKETPEGLQERLDQLFQTTPPTAIIVDDPFLYLVVNQHLARRGILCPEQVSMVCGDPHPMFEWMLPKVTHIAWDPAPLVRRMVRWVHQLAEGKNDLSQHKVTGSLVEGGTVGQVPAEG